MINPFIEANENRSRYEQRIPNFPRTTQISIRLSEETITVILKMLGYDHNDRNASRHISDFLEQIGMCALLVTEIPLEIDEESGVTTEDCRQSGYEDGMLGNPKYFATIYGNMRDVFQQSYLRGFFEGNFIRNAGKK